MPNYPDFSKEIKEAAVKEYIETGKVKAVSKKFGVSSRTIYNWKDKLCPVTQALPQNDIKLLKKQLEDKELENQVLRELLKKTYLVMKID